MNDAPSGRSNHLLYDRVLSTAVTSISRRTASFDRGFDLAARTDVCCTTPPKTTNCSSRAREAAAVGGGDSLRSQGWLSQLHGDRYRPPPYPICRRRRRHHACPPTAMLMGSLYLHRNSYVLSIRTKPGNLYPFGGNLLSVGERMYVSTRIRKIPVSELAGFLANFSEF